MKRIIAAALLAAITVPTLALEVGPPYEQTVQDMQLPNVKDPVVTDSTSSGATFFGMKERAPYEQTVANMKLPDVKDPVIKQPSTQVAGPVGAA